MKLKLLSTLIVFLLLIRPPYVSANSTWQIQSIDTMKYSRDLAREKLNDDSFTEVIENQITQIANTGVTHVAVGTPYDEEFIPYLSRWVIEIRKHNLKVWFRGNFSGWEGWFNYPEISQSQHLLLLASFISKNHNLFEDGDIFTPCTECENGGPGDPRNTRDIEGYRNFLILERETAMNSFAAINKKVETGYFSMNGDVARLIMDKDTTAKLGGIVVVDHYVKDTEKLAKDIKEFTQISGGKIVLGEFGAPIPDIHGEMDEETQNQWISDAMSKLSRESNLLGVNYWVSEDGTTAIWDNNQPKKAVATITNYFKPKEISINIVDALQKPIEGAEIASGTKIYFTRGDGWVHIDKAASQIVIKKEGYKDMAIESIPENNSVITIELNNESLWFKIQKLFVRLRKRFNSN